jgi:hypothetical protein
MSEKTEITHKELGFNWKLTIKTTTRTPVKDSKYDNVTEAEATMGGNTETYSGMVDMMKSAKKEINIVLSGEEK